MTAPEEVFPYSTLRTTEPPAETDLRLVRESGKHRTHDPVNRPRHYTSHPSGVECIQVTEHFSFCVGNAIKYLWRADLKHGLEDLEKAQWYVTREIQRRKSLPQEGG